MNALAHRRVWIFSALILILGLLLVVPQVLAQDDTQEVELVGLIEAMDNFTITVNQLAINYTGAEVQTTLAMGAAVKVEGLLLDDGSVQATEIKAAETGLQPGESEFTGVLQRFDGSVMTVSGITFDVSNAELESGLQTGDLVKVHATLSANGVWVAREVSRQETDADDDNMGDGDSSSEDGEDFEIVGTLDQIGNGSIVVSGQTINTANAEIEDRLVVGMLVKAEVTLVNGELVAFKVESFASDDSDDNGDDDGQSGACEFEVEVNSINLRTGPGTGYGNIGYGYKGDEYPVIAVHSSGAWVHVATGSGAAWAGLEGGELSGNCAGLSVDDEPFKAASDDSVSSPFDDDHSDDMSDDHGSDDSDDDSSDDHGDDDSSDDHGDDDDSSDDHGSDDSSDDHGDDDSSDDHGDDDSSDDSHDD